MGASLVHGRRLEKRRTRYADGSEAAELFVEGGGWEFPTYSSIAHLIRFCQERGLDRAAWPIFYGIWEGDVCPEEIHKRCGALRRVIERLSPAECDSCPLLSRVRDWLARGEVFAVFQ